MREQLKKLREEMKKEGIDIYMVTMDDDHQSEYVGAYYREIAEISGFTGSAGTLVVTMEEAGLWTDGRYFVQAGNQLKDSGIRLMKMGEPETPALSAFIAEKMPKGGTFGFNGRCVSYTEAKELIDALSEKEAKLKTERDLPDAVWENRPKPCFTKLYILEEKYAGKSAGEKLSDLKAAMKRERADAHVITMLDDIAWLLNLRADDIPNNPVFLSFLMVKGEEVTLYTDESHLTDAVKAYLSALSVKVDTDTEHIYRDTAALSEGSILVESGKTNYALMSAIPAGIRVIDRMLPTTIAKCKKNPVEMSNLKKAHVKDGTAVTKFMYWFKKALASGEEITECSAAEKLHEFRKAEEGFIEESFETISAYGANAAMCHYSPSKERDVAIERKGLYLVDSGGQYYEGTTDITRTWACGETTKEERTSFTLSVISNLRLSDAKFLEGTNGVALDYIAREPFWTRGLNYNHGTGHGVGYLLNVHERPIGIRYRIVPERQDSFPLSEGQFVSDEPGLYIEGSHGVRTENMIMCVNDYRNEYGQFCKFDVYTMCPMDKDALEISLMTDRDIALFNAYHKTVYKTLCGRMNEEERAWLFEACAPIER